MQYIQGCLFEKNLKELREMYMAFLKEEGYKPTLYYGGEILFEYKEHEYWLDINGADEHYYRIYLPHPWNFDSDEEETRTLKAINTVNFKYKVGKMCFGEMFFDSDFDSDKVEGIIVTADLFLANQDDLKFFFRRCLDMLLMMFLEFATKIMEEETQIDEKSGEM